MNVLTAIIGMCLVLGFCVFALFHYFMYQLEKKQREKETEAYIRCLKKKINETD